MPLAEPSVRQPQVAPHTHTSVSARVQIVTVAILLPMLFLVFQTRRCVPHQTVETRHKLVAGRMRSTFGSRRQSLSQSPAWRGLSVPFLPADNSAPYYQQLPPFPVVSYQVVSASLLPLLSRPLVLNLVPCSRSSTQYQAVFSQAVSYQAMYRSSALYHLN
jgi:hypothetical protein